ncbi:MAG: hypothetical protein ATN34_04525 [Epulopiscium sp. Nele67-Bin002]|nr:MAG: hypothetical protein ATN33_02310 [Epulopiscium sp. Nele67-Bin001]OON91834.1 MAG: hypothetical protein ATN34_04525 [Epulopiscium sp. Nele67-Bin002]
MKKFLIALIVTLAIMVSAVYANVETDKAVEPKCEKIAYFTFDDGPSAGVTEAIMDELDRLNIKATFFVVGKEMQDKEDLIKRMFDDGHGVGLHTYTHNYDKVYSSTSMFLEEMKQVNDYINEIMGRDMGIKYIRFPGGSSGRLNQDMYDQIKAAGYNIFDWNVNIEDGVKPNATVEELVEAGKECSNKMTEKIILAHCNLNNWNTVKAIEGLYNYYTELGYRFEAITNDTPEFYYRFNK